MQVLCIARTYTDLCISLLLRLIKVVIVSCNNLCALYTLHPFYLCVLLVS